MVHRFSKGKATCLRIMGGIPSPPIALEGSQEGRAEKVSSSEMVIEQREGRVMTDTILYFS